MTPIATPSLLFAEYSPFLFLFSSSLGSAILFFFFLLLLLSPYSLLLVPSSRGSCESYCFSPQLLSLLCVCAHELVFSYFFSSSFFLLQRLVFPPCGPWYKGQNCNRDES